MKNKILEYLYFTVVCDSFYYLSAIILYNDITNIIYGILWSYHINFAFICLQIKDTIVNEMYVASYSVAFCKKKIAFYCNWIPINWNKCANTSILDLKSTILKFHNKLSKYSRNGSLLIVMIFNNSKFHHEYFDYV